MTGKVYRLLSEAEREYVTRAGTKTPFWWGTSIMPTQANYDGSADPYKGSGFQGVYRRRTVPVDSFEPTDANPNRSVLQSVVIGAAPNREKVVVAQQLSRIRRRCASTAAAAMIGASVWPSWRRIYGASQHIPQCLMPSCVLRGQTPDFFRLLKVAFRNQGSELAVYAFDLLHLNGQDLRPYRLSSAGNFLSGCSTGHDALPTRCARLHGRP